MRTFFLLVALVLLEIPTSLFAQNGSSCCMSGTSTPSDSNATITGTQSVVPAWPDQENPNRNRNALDRIFIETVTGAFVSVAVSVPSAFVGAIIGPHLEQDYGDDPGLRTAYNGLLVGAALGSALGVHWAGNGLEDEGNFNATVLGSFIGTGSLFLISGHLGESATLAVWGFPTLGALIGHKVSAARMRSRSAEVPDDRVQLMVVPLERGGLGLGLSYNF